MKVKVTRNFQVTIPSEIREKLGIKEGDYVEVTLDESNGTIIIKPYIRKWTTIRLNKKVGQEDIDKAVGEALNDSSWYKYVSFSTFEDSENHSKALEIIEKEDVKIPQIVVYEFLWVLAKLTSDVSLIKTKIEELREFEIICESPEIILNGVKMLKEDGKPLKMLNDYVVLALAKELKGDLATYDEKLRKIAEKHGVRIIP